MHARTCLVPLYACEYMLTEVDMFTSRNSHSEYVELVRLLADSAQNNNYAHA